MRSSIDKTSGKSRGEQIPKRVTLLQEPRNDTACFRRAILQRCSSRVTVQSTHGNSKQGATSQELFICLAETSAELEDHEEELVDDEWPFAAPSIGGDSEGDRADRSQHQHQGDSPCDVGHGFIE